MPSYNLSVLGLEVSFKTDADQKRVSEAKKLVEDCFNGLNERGRTLSKEKILTLLTLSLADDYLQSERRLQELEKRIEKLLMKLEKEQ